MQKLFILLLFLVACKEGPEEIPQGIIPPDSMINIMAEVHIAEAVMMNTGSPSFQRNLRSAYMQKVFSETKTDTARFKSSFDFYANHPGLFAEMYEQVIVEISKRQAEKK